MQKVSKTFRNARVAVVTSSSSPRAPCAGWRRRTPGAGVLLSGVPGAPLGRVHSPEGTEDSRDTPSRATSPCSPRGHPLCSQHGSLNRSTGAELCPALCHPSSWRRGSARGSSPAPRGMWGSRKHRPSEVCGDGAAPRARHSPAPAALAGDICSPEAMATCGKLAEARAGLGNLKQH